MLDKIIALSIRHPFMIGCMTLALIAWGLWSATRLPIDAVPDITNNQVQIITTCPTLAAQEVEQLVTYPVEQSIANLPDIEELRSISRFGLSVITVVFRENTDIYFARQLLFERINEAKENIPSEVGTPELAPVSTGLGEIYQYIIHPKKGREDQYTAMDLRTMQDWIVARQLTGTPGIAEINSFGGLVKQYEVAVDPDRLPAMEVTLPEIFNALQQNNENTGGAYIDKKPNAYFIRGVGLISSFEDIKNIVVKVGPSGIPILIKDVAEVGWGHAVRYGALTYNGESDVVGGVVMMLKGANSAEVVRNVKEKMKTIQQSLPEDVVIEPYLDRTDLVNRAIRTVEKNLMEGALIVIFVLVLFLGNFRAGLIVASAIPLSLLFALGMMHVFGVSANLMSLGAIDFGLIVDGAVIIVESVFYRFHTSHVPGARISRDRIRETVLESARRMMGSAVFGQVIILIVYLPILTLEGIEGKMFKPMAQTVSFAILGALILSLTYIPMMTSLLLGGNVKPGKTFADRILEVTQRIYDPLLRLALKSKRLLLALAILLFSGSVYVFTRIGAEFIPTLQEGDFAFHCILPQGTSLSQSMETSMQAMRLIRSFDEVKMVVGKTGSAEVPTDPMPPEASDMMIILKPPKEWKEKKPYGVLAAEMMEALEVIPGAFFETNQPIQMRFNELMTGIRQDVAVKIFGEDLDTLLHYGNQAADVIGNVPGVAQPMVERISGLSQITVHYNRAQMAGYGISVEGVNHMISTAFAGGKAGVVFENERRFDLVVRLSEDHRDDISDIRSLYVSTADGHQVPLTQIAEIRYEQGPAQISREDGQRRIVVGFNVQGRDVASVVKEIRADLDREVPLPEGYYFTFGGTFENLQAATSRLLLVVPIALALIFILLYFAFHSFRQAFLVYSAIPMSAIGGILALWMRGMPFSISAGVGFVALFGVAVLNGIVLVSTFNQLEKEGELDIIRRVIRGTQIRLRPVLMTATVASLGFLPMALSHGAGAEVQKPLATVVIGGLVSATFLTLFLLPALYVLFSGKIRSHGAVAAVNMLLVFVISTGEAQPAIQEQSSKPIYDLEQVTRIAFSHNLQLKSDSLMIQSGQVKVKSAYELPKTSLSVQYGQYNSLQKDNAFSLEQKFFLPGYYKARAGWFGAESEARKIDFAVNMSEIRSAIAARYDELVYLEKVRQELIQMDSVYQAFVEASARRVAAGEATPLEKATALAQQGQLRLALQQNAAAASQAFAELRRWMSVPEDFAILIPEKYRLEKHPEESDSNLVAQHPYIRRAYQEADLTGMEKRFEAMTLKPEFSIGYFNQSIIGTQTVQGQEMYYDGTKRFQGVTIGMEIPLLPSAGRSRWKALEAKESGLRQKAAWLESSAVTTWKKRLAALRSVEDELAYYELVALPQAMQILREASSGYRHGAINYLEYTAALQTATQIKLRHLEATHQYNQLVLDIRSITQP